MIRRDNKTSPFVAAILLLTMIFQAQPLLAMSSDVIRQRIESQASGQPELKDAQVAVTVEDGFVLLSGIVRLYHQ